MSINHRAEAEKHLANAGRHLTEVPGDMRIAEVAAWIGQGHAALAAGESAGADVIAYRHTLQTMRFALIRHVAEGLALSNGDEAHQHARGLAQHLDSVGLNVDREADAYIEGHLGWGDSHDAWLPPTERRAKWDAENPCPF